MQVLTLSVIIATVHVVSAFYGQHHVATTHSHSLCKPCRPSLLSYKIHYQPHVSTRHTTLITLQSIEDPTLVEELAISGTIGLLANSIVERTGIANDLIKDEPTLDDSSASTSSLLLYSIADSIDDAAWVYFILTLIVAIDMKFDIHYVDSTILKGAIPTIVITVGLARVFSVIKRTLILQRISGKTLGRTKIYDQFIDYVLTICTSSVVLSELQLDDNVGMGFKSLFAVSGVSALFFSLLHLD